MRRDRARVDDLHVPLRRDLFELFGLDRHGGLQYVSRHCPSGPSSDRTDRLPERSGLRVLRALAERHRERLLLAVADDHDVDLVAGRVLAHGARDVVDAGRPCAPSTSTITSPFLMPAFAGTGARAPRRRRPHPGRRRARSAESGVSGWLVTPRNAIVRLLARRAASSMTGFAEEIEIAKPTLFDVSGSRSRC